jgi:hypothetical protein
MSIRCNHPHLPIQGRKDCVPEVTVSGYKEYKEKACQTHSFSGKLFVSFTRLFFFFIITSQDPIIFKEFSIFLYHSLVLHVIRIVGSELASDLPGVYRDVLYWKH